MFDQDLGHLCRGRRVQISGHSHFVDASAILERFRFLLECKLILHRLLVLHIQVGHLRRRRTLFSKYNVRS